MKDYNSLNKNAIIDLLKKKKVEFSTNADKETLVKLLLKSEGGNKKKEISAKQVKKEKVKKTTEKEARPKKVSIKIAKKAREAPVKKTSDKEQKAKTVPDLAKHHYIKDELEKFYPLPDYKFLKAYDFRIPESFNFHKLGLFVVDPYWVYAYWEIKKEVLQELTKKHSARVVARERLFLRVFDITYLNFDGTNAHTMWEVRVDSFKGNWFVNVNKPDSNFIAKLGFKDLKNNFIEVLTSNIIKTPRDRMSDNIVQLWGMTDIDKPLALTLKEGLKEHLKYQYKIEFISSLPGSIFGSMTFIKNKKDS